MKVWKIGSRCNLIARGGSSREDIGAFINKVMIEPENQVSYYVSWWNGRDKKSEWVFAHEIRGNADQAYENTQTIGFK